VVSIKWARQKREGGRRQGWPLQIHVIQSEPEMKKTTKSSKTIRANNRKAKLKAKRCRQRARATG
jgi:hypothetical protein